MEAVVSIIVPVYNAAEYLERCITSILNQSYKNIELILVDDGSEDESKNICDYYSKTDRRVNMISRSHQGISAARNVGLKLSLGEYIMFVDADDWIEEDCVQYAVSEIRKMSASLLVFGYSDSVENLCAESPVKILSTDEALMLLTEDISLHSYLWNKIYRRTLFDSLYFPYDRNFEDIAVMHKLFDRAGKIALSDKVLYHYEKRENSISRSFNPQNVLDYFFAESVRLLYYDEFHPELSALQTTKLMELLLSYYAKFINNSGLSEEEFQKLKDKFTDDEKFIERYFKSAHAPFTKAKFKVMYSLFHINKSLYKSVYRMVNSLRGKLKAH